VTGILIRVLKEGDRHKRIDHTKTETEVGAVMSQGAPRMTSSHQKLGKGME
jgi:hypothetical protein